MSEPSQTLYIHNINEKIPKNVLKKMLYMLFSQHGKIIQIVACKGVKLRGQAWVSFEDVNAASNALRSKQGFNFYDKPLNLDFAKSKSHIIAKKELAAGGGAKQSNKRGRDQVEEDIQG